VSRVTHMRNAFSGARAMEDKNKFSSSSKSSRNGKP